MCHYGILRNWHHLCIIPIVLWIETMYIHKKAFYISEKFQTMGKVFLEPSILSLGPSFIAKSFGEMGLIGQGVIVVILILMIVSIYITIERYLLIRKANNLDDSFMHRIRENVLNGNVAAAKDLMCSEYLACCAYDWKRCFKTWPFTPRYQRSY